MPRPGTPADSVTTARKAWGEDLPPEVLALAEACVALGSQTAAARAIGYSGSVVSSVLGRKYKGAYPEVFARIQATFMRATVDCPILGPIPGSQCSEIQRTEDPRGLTETRLFRACRSGCCHSQLAAYRHVHRARKGGAAPINRKETDHAAE